jgi:hypothetical protein
VGINKDEKRKGKERRARNAKYEISGYRRAADAIYILLAYYAAGGGDVQNECGVLLIIILLNTTLAKPRRHTGGVEVQLHSLTSALDAGESSVSRPSRFTP